MSYNLARDGEADTQGYKPARRNPDHSLYRIPFPDDTWDNTPHPAENQIEAGKASFMRFAKDVGHQPELVTAVCDGLYDDGLVCKEAADSYSLLTEYKDGSRASAKTGTEKGQRASK